VLLIKDINYGYDIQYYYLGRVAEEFHSYDAAEKYYAQSNEKNAKFGRCLGSGCFGLDFPEDTNARLEKIANLRK